MLRQSSTPVQYAATLRPDFCNLMTSGRAGVVTPIGYAPLLRGDSATGQCVVSFQLREMPRVVVNPIFLNLQAWFVPKSAMPQFSGYDEFMHSYQGKQIKALGAVSRDAPDFFEVESTVTALRNSTFLKTLGLHPYDPMHVDLIDAFNYVYNFRLAAHSSKLPRRKYYSEDATEAVALPPAFWPSGPLRHVVPDYERDIVVGSLDLDVIAGSLPVTGIAGPTGTPLSNGNANGVTESSGETVSYARFVSTRSSDAGAYIRYSDDGAHPEVFAEMAGQHVSVSLQNIDKARETVAFAKMRQAFAGQNFSGFDPDDVLIAELMQGLRVPDEVLRRPWLLDSKRVEVMQREREATDGANLDVSQTRGFAQASLSVNVPRSETGGIIIFTAEVMPERIYERMSDEWLHLTAPDQLPDALVDSQRVEPVDEVPNRRVDAAHSSPGAVYGYEEMNAKWKREFTRLGGHFRELNPSSPATENRQAVWNPRIVDPSFTEDHYLAPVPFPHDVFADTAGDCWEANVTHNLTIKGLTVFGQQLVEDNGEFAATEGEEA